MKLQNGIFYAVFDDLSYKCPMVLMEYPFFSPSKEPYPHISEWRDYKGKFLKVMPGADGSPTIYDLRILIFITSQLVAAKEFTRPTSRKIKLHVNKLLTELGSKTGSSEYNAIKSGIRRLKTTSIETTVSEKNTVTNTGFSLIDSYVIVTDKRTGRMLSIDLVVSEWLYEEIMSDRVKTLSPDYFSLTSPFQMRLYLIFHKHLGNQHAFQIGLKKLHMKHGSKDTESKFRYKLKAIDAQNKPVLDLIITTLEKDLIAVLRHEHNDAVQCE